MKKFLSLFFVICLLVAGCTTPKLDYSKAWEFSLANPAYALTMSKDGNYIAVGVEGSKGGVVLLDGSGKKVWENVVGTSVHSIATDSTGKYFAAGDERGRLHLYGRDGKVIWTKELANPIAFVVMTPDGKYVAAGERFGTGFASVYLYLIDGLELWSKEVKARTESLAISNRGDVLFGGWDSVYLVDKDGKELWFREVKGAVKSVAFSIDGTQQLVGLDKGVVLLLNRSGETKELNFSTWSFVLALNFLESGLNIITAVEEGRIYMTNLAGKNVWRYDTKSTIQALGMTPDGSQIVVGTVNGLEFTDNKGKKKGEILITDGVTKLALSSDGSKLAAISGSKVYLFSKQ